MRRLRWCGLLLALMVCGPPATARAQVQPRDTPAKLTKTIVGARSVVHYTDAAGDPDAITATRAQEFADLLDAAARVYTGLGYTIKPDADGKVDAYVYIDPEHLQAVARSDPNSGTGDRTGYIRLQPTSTDRSPVHEMFHVAHFGTDARSPRWLYEGVATWAETLFTKVGRPYLTPSGVSLDCHAPDVEVRTCGGDERGYGRYAFFGSLAMDQGPGFMATVLARMRTLGSGPARFVPVLQELLAAKGSSVAEVYLRTQERLLDDTIAGAPRSTAMRFGEDDILDTGVFGGATARRDFTLDHLATQYLWLRGGDAENASTCARRELRVTVTAPADAVTRPVLDQRGEAPIIIPVAGGTGSITVPWAACGLANAYVAVPNAGLTADDQPFALTTELVAPAVPQDTTPPALAALKVVNGRLKGRASEDSLLSIAVMRGGKVLARLTRNVTAGTFRVALPRSARAKRVRLKVTARDVAGNRSRARVVVS